MAEASDYFLTEDELKRLFEERVLEHVFGPYQPQTQPVLVLVGAQQAAGKSWPAVRQSGSPAVRRVTITDRTGADLYVLDKASGQATDPAEVAGALIDIRARPLPQEEARSWMTRQCDTVITYAVRGTIDDTSRPTLTQITQHDAARIMLMADPRPDGALRVAYEVARPLLEALGEEPLEPNLSVFLQTDEELRTQLSRSGQHNVTAEFARRGTLTTQRHTAESMIRRQLHTALATARGLDPDVQDALGALGAQTPRAALNQPAPAVAPEPRRPAETAPDVSPGLD